MRSFKLELYLSQYEFKAPYIMCASDAESISMRDLIAMAGKPELSMWENLRLGYTEDNGHPLLREVIAASIYEGISEDNVLCFAGAEEGILCALQSICSDEDHVITFKPCYQSLAEIPKSRGCEVTEIELLEAENWQINISRVEENIRSNTKVIVINFPHNPTGQVITQEQLDELINLCRKYDIWLFSDEVYRLLGEPNESWAKPVANLYEKGISLGVLSKSLGLPGLRIGWIAAQDKELLNRAKCRKHYSSICNSAPSEILGIMAIKNKDNILDRTNSITRNNLILLQEFINNNSNYLSWVKPQGGCIGYVQCKEPILTDDLCHNSVEKAGILLLPGSVYDDKSNSFRVGFGRADFPDVIKRFEDFFNSYVS